MATGRLTASDVVMRVVAVGLALTGVAMVVVGIAMFWGPLRQVLAAPVVVLMGVAAYIGGRAAWWIVDQDVQARA
ncbi:hypothetical protein ABT150_23660 [Streptomyces mirabilis]|uniref:hypothetical protein n=1 Tax=Streptomyces mirabilis TaxID=68239 RepID=UPI0033186A7A